MAQEENPNQDPRIPRVLVYCYRGKIFCQFVIGEMLTRYLYIGLSFLCFTSSKQSQFSNVTCQIY